MALHEEQVQSRNLANSGMALIWTSGTDKLRSYFNEPWLRFTGRTLEQEMNNGWTEGVHPDDFAHYFNAYITAFDKHEPFEMEYRLCHVSGEYRWINSICIPDHDSSGEFIGYIGYCFDITERKLAEEALHKSEETFSKAFHTSPIAITITRIEDGMFVEVNDAFTEMMGFTREQILAHSSVERNLWVHEEDRQCVVADLLAGRTVTDREYLLRTKSGEIITVLLSAQMIQMSLGSCILCSLYNITQRILAEKAQLASELRYRRLFESAKDGILILDAETGMIVDVNPFLMTLLGYSHEEFLGKRVWELGFLQTIIPNLENFLELKEKGYIRYEDIPLKTSSGTGIDVEFVSNVYLVNDLKVIQCNIRNITERKQAEKALRESDATVRNKLTAILDPEGDLGVLDLADIIDQEALQTLMEDFYKITHIGIGILDVHGKVLVACGWQDICTKFHRGHPDTLKNCIESDVILSKGVPVGMLKTYKCKNNLWEVMTPIEIGGRHLGNICLGQFLYEDEIPDYELFRSQARQYGFDEKEYLAAYDRIQRWSRETVEAVMAFYTNLAGMISSISYSTVKLSHTLTQKEIALRRLEESEARNRALLSAIPDLIFTNRRDGEFLAIHSSDSSLLFLPQEAFLHRRVEDVLPGPLAELFMKAFAQTLDTDVLQEIEYAIPIEGEEKHFEARVVPCTEDTVITIVRDITMRKHAEEAQRHLQAQFQQAQKMESLGVLAGGVAHDMNNVLGAILIAASTNIEAQSVGSPAYRAFDTISRAAARGGHMVKTLLSFARQSPAEEHELDMNEVLREEVRLLERTTLSKIRLELDLASDLWPIRGDASALIHAFMNLCVNAVDAMPEKGTLTLRTRNVDNAWIEALVEDTGTGMSKEVLEKATDPFFTTKEVGKGTGLGLSMVYSIVKAHQGQMEIQSEPGQGTRVRIRFPACEVVVQAPEPAAEPRSKSFHGTLNVLLVDDDELIQSSIQALLEALGHNVTAVLSGEKALAKLEAGFQPDVVILDMNMPGIGGVGTLPRLRALHPTVPVLLATGRADQTVLDLIEAHPFVTLLSKPFSMKELQLHLDLLGRG